MLAHGLGLPYYGSPYLTDLEQIAAIVGNNEGAVFDVASAFNRNAIWEDSARTTPASVDGPVGSIQDELLRYYATQATGAARPTLRTDGAGKYWLEGSGTQYMIFAPAVAITGGELQVAAARHDPLSANRVMVGNRTNSDSVGGAVTFSAPTGETVISARIAGNFVAATGAALTMSAVDVVADGWITAQVGTIEAATNGQQRATNSITRVGGNTNYGLMTFFPNAAAPTSPSLTMVGRLYAAAVVGSAGTDASRAVFRSWAASRCVDNPL